MPFKLDTAYINIYTQQIVLQRSNSRKPEPTTDIKIIQGPPGLVKPAKSITSITEEHVNTYIRESPEAVTNYVRNERVMETQRKQMNARSLYIYIYIYMYSYQTWRINKN